MMQQATHQTEVTAAWGVATGLRPPVSLRLCRRADAGYRVERVERAAGIHTGLDAPLAVTIADEAVLFRRLELPPAEGEVLSQMVASQLEVLLPIPLEELAHAGARAGDGAVLAAAAKRSAVASMPGVGVAAAVVPEAVTVAHAIRRFFPLEAGRSVVLHVGAHGSSLLLLGPLGLEHAAVVDEGSADWADGAAAGAAWLRDAIEAGKHLLSHLPEAGRPRVLYGVGDPSAAGPSLVDLAAALGMELQALPAPRGLNTPADASVEAMLPALGAALSQLEPGPMWLSLGGDAATAAPVSAQPRVPRRLLAAAGVALACLVALYGLDVYQASRLEASVTDTAQRGQTSLRRSLAMGQYLLNQPAPPLVVVDALSSAAAERVQLKRFEYDGDGRLRVSGEANGVADLDKSLSGFSRTPPLERVEMRSASVERDKWTFDVEARLVPLHRHLALDAIERARQARETRAKEESQAAKEDQP